MYQNFKKQDLQAHGSLSGDKYIDVLDDIVKKYNDTVHSTIKIKPVDVTFDSYAERK